MRVKIIVTYNIAFFFIGHVSWDIVILVDMQYVGPPIKCSDNSNADIFNAFIIMG